MTERLTVLPETDRKDQAATQASGLPGGVLLDRLERAVMLTLARMGDNRLLVPLAAAGLKTEVRARRLLERGTTAVWHAYQLPTRREVLTLSEQLSALRFRVEQLEQSRASKARR